MSDHTPHDDRPRSLLGLRRLAWRVVYPDAAAYADSSAERVQSRTAGTVAELQEQVSGLRARVDELENLLAAAQARLDSVDQRTAQAESSSDDVVARLEEFDARLRAVTIELRATNNRINWIEENGPATRE